jgi:hypothetical protein
VPKKVIFGILPEDGAPLASDTLASPAAAVPE